MTDRFLWFLVLSPAAATLACAGGSSVPPPEPTATERTADLGTLPEIDTPPGAEAFTNELRVRLASALAAADGAPRTRHVREDGSPKYANRLILESSPYLRQHAHNPVNWYPWGDEAFEAARRLGRPVLLSVGYSTCHWCHVMEEESFEDLEIARFLNEHYVAIKVDREVRPDVDAVFMAAVQRMTGRGGWPMTVWLTPDRRPFYGGTYFPARDGERGSRTGFLSMLRGIADRWQDDRASILSAADGLTADLRRAFEPASNTAAAALPGTEVGNLVVNGLRGQFDATHGGLRRAPKFPSDLPLRFLLRHHARTGDPGSLRMVTTTLESMAAGGIHDQIGGGFHRYSTDAIWLVPHFEKMLYDNARLVIAYLEAWRVTGDERLADVVRSTLAYLDREMSDPAGGFRSATDADSAGPDGRREEGLFFTWTPAEIREELSDPAATWFIEAYGVGDEGDVDGRNVLHVAETPETLTAETTADPATIAATLADARRQLFEVRARRPAPLQDDKVLAAWNGLAISAFAQAGRWLAEPAWTARATRAADFVLANLRDDDGHLRRSWRDGHAEGDGFLDDHSFLISGLLDVYEATADVEKLEAAMSLQDALDTRFVDRERGGYFFSANDREKMLVRDKPSRDGAVPSGNSVALSNLLRLSALTGEDRYRAAADRLLSAFAVQLKTAPGSLGELLVAVEMRSAGVPEVVIVTPRDPAEAQPFADALRHDGLRDVAWVVAVEGADLERQAQTIAPLRGKRALKGRTTVYVCEGGVCRLPASDPEAFLERLREIEDPAPLAAEESGS